MHRLLYKMGPSVVHAIYKAAVIIHYAQALRLGTVFVALLFSHATQTCVLYGTTNIICNI